MDQNLPRLYKDYGAYSNWRNMPSAIDGLKPVERRVLLSAYKIARPKLVKSRQVDAYCIGHYHPHGNVYGSIVQMVRQGFLIGQGNFGTNIGVEPIGPAADRYTECQMHPKTVEMAFKYVDYCDWIDTELGDKEPTNLPTMFPFCLMGTEYTQGIGFGFKTYIPCYATSDLYKRLLWLLGIRKTQPTIAPITNCKILSPNSDLETLLKTGKGRIEVEGIIDVNKTNNTVTLKSWPPGKKFESFLNKFSKELGEKLIGFTDLSVTETNIVFQVIRERNRDTIFEQFVEKLKTVIKGFISFEVVAIDEKLNVVTTPIDEMLLSTYKRFLNINNKMLNHEVKKIDDNINEYNVLCKIRPHIASGVASKLSPENILVMIEKQTGVPKEISKELMSKYRINKLLTLDTDTSDLQNKKNELLTNIQQIDKFVLEQYTNIV